MNTNDNAPAALPASAASAAQASGENNANQPHDDAGNQPAVSTANPCCRVAPTTENPHGYPPFDMSHLPHYTNNQITYYFTTGVIPANELPRFRQLMEQRRAFIDLIGWDGASEEDNKNGD